MKSFLILLVISTNVLFAFCAPDYSTTSSSSASASAQAHADSSVVVKSKDHYYSSSSSSSSSSKSSSNSTTVITNSKESGQGCCKKNERWVECPIILCVPETCDQLGGPISCPRIDPRRCPVKPACVCIEGYVRNKNGVCIPKSQCLKCGENERFVECPDAFCEPSHCIQLGQSFLCPVVIPGHCPRKPGCICVEGYVRNNNDTCIPKEQCPTCAGDPNAVAGCGFLCGKRCGVRDTAPKPCPCEINGCQCKPGFIYDGNQRLCVRPEKCTKPCPKNEVYNSCANGGCGKWNCTQIDEPILCIDPIKCYGGCICKEDYLRSLQGVCIPQEECRKNLCPKQNQVFDPCPLACPPRKCGINDAAVLCAADQPCLPAGCRCKDGFYRNGEECVAMKDCPPTEEEETTTEGPAISPGACPVDGEERITNANADFSGLFLDESVKTQPGANLIMSPFSVIVPISELAFGSSGNTQKQFLDVLNLTSVNDIQCVIPPLLDALSNQDNVILNLEARLFVTDEYPLKEGFVEFSRNVVGAEVASLDFNKPQAAADAINAWAANATNNRITSIATPDAITPSTRLILANAIYFLGNWTHQFNEDNTEVRDFHVTEDKTVQTKIMYQQNSFKYGESSDLDCQIVVLPYKNQDFTFVVFLPRKIDALSALVTKLRDSEAFYKAYDSTSYEKVNVYLPSFKVESQFDLGDIMQKAGMTDAFDPAKSQLTNIMKDPEPLIITAAIQKAYIEVNAKGTEAAAVNVVPGEAGSVYKIDTFEANHPFVF